MYKEGVERLTGVEVDELQVCVGLDPALVKSVKRGILQIIKEQSEEWSELFDNYSSREEVERVGNRHRQRMVDLFWQSGLTYWPFHQELISQGQEESLRTGKNAHHTEAHIVLSWLGGIEEIAGHSGV